MKRIAIFSFFVLPLNTSVLGFIGWLCFKPYALNQLVYIGEKGNGKNDRLLLCISLTWLNVGEGTKIAHCSTGMLIFFFWTPRNIMNKYFNCIFHYVLPVNKSTECVLPIISKILKTTRACMGNQMLSWLLEICNCNLQWFVTLGVLNLLYWWPVIQFHD